MDAPAHMTLARIYIHSQMGRQGSCYASNRCGGHQCSFPQNTRSCCVPCMPSALIYLKQLCVRRKVMQYCIFTYTEIPGMHDKDMLICCVSMWYTCCLVGLPAQTDLLGLQCYKIDMAIQISRVCAGSTAVSFSETDAHEASIRVLPPRSVTRHGDRNTE